MSTIDTDAQLFETITSEEVVYHNYDEYASRSIYPLEFSTHTAATRVPDYKTETVAEKILAEVSGVIRHIDKECVEVELYFPNRPLLVSMPKVLFSKLDDIYIGLEIQYQIINDTSGIKRQNIREAQKSSNLSPDILELKKNILSLLAND